MIRSPGDHRLETALGLLCAVPLAVILAVTFLDVFARYLFSAPIRGSVEIIEFAMALVIFGALPLVTRSRGHVTVGLLDGVVGTGAGRRIKQLLCDALSVIALALLAWRLWGHAGGQLEEASRSIVLGLPHAPLTYVMFALALLSMLLMLALMWRGDARTGRGAP
jgi:TRAP-type transport system small permease protein